MSKTFLIKHLDTPAAVVHAKNAKSAMAHYQKQLTEGDTVTELSAKEAMALATTGLPQYDADADDEQGGDDGFGTPA